MVRPLPPPPLSGRTTSGVAFFGFPSVHWWLRTLSIPMYLTRLGWRTLCRFEISCSMEPSCLVISDHGHYELNFFCRVEFILYWTLLSGLTECAKILPQICLPQMQYRFAVTFGTLSIRQGAFWEYDIIIPKIEKKVTNTFLSKYFLGITVKKSLSL